MKGKIGLLIAVLLTAIMAVAGCKGESGGGSDAPSLPSIPLKNSNIRIEQANDSWTESMSGIYTIGTATYAVTGTMNTVEYRRVPFRVKSFSLHFALSYAMVAPWLAHSA